ncbi:DNA-binding transcriptional LysR family regulator [Angulomicrobium tetraedrale]|uniref:DNA-binding transcriptional LysR family regulator n=1 Tax=Ancylobacter tetraedralis TaxID=217068 RepID=A0A839ZDJ1_9HYPH|nr:LysR family transcriptional regulator [Ancylobacter tetraedralis]MBB3772861.1 DNA-binding transcriptional LysR family regulator [Ancylobacter tetraedralis]
MRRLDNIDLRLLRVFVVLAQEGGFQDAQIALNLSQSTLSTHLAALERKLGGQLCERGRAGFRLTPFGEAILAAALQLFEDIDAFHGRIGRDQQRLVGRLRVGIVDGVVTNPRLGLQTALARYMAYASEVFVDLELGTPLVLERALMDGVRDVVIGPFSQKVPGITYVPLHREPQALYCGRGHPLFALPAEEISHARIEEALFSVRRYRHLDDLYRVNHPRASAAIVQMEAQVMMILSGRFIGYLPRHIGEDWAGRGQMRVLRPESYGFASPHFAATRRLSGEQPLVDAFLRELVAQARTGAGEAAPPEAGEP